MPGSVRTWRWGEDLAELRRLVERGGVAAIPSESSYGLGADPRNPHGVAAIYDLKGREAGKPLPVVAADLEQIAALGIDPEDPAVAAASRCWPAPLTVIAPLTRALPAAAGGKTLAVRIPAHDRLRALLAELSTALTATSANAAGAAPILDPGELEPLLRGSDAFVVDDGLLPGGPPSTLVEWHDGGFKVLRAGAFPPSRLHEEVGV